MFLRRGVKTVACPLCCLKMFLSMMDLSEDGSTQVGANVWHACAVRLMKHGLPKR